MNGVLMSFIENVGVQSPVTMENVPVKVSMPRREFTPQRFQSSFAMLVIIASLVGSLTVASAGWQFGQASRAGLIRPTHDVWIKARITTIGGQSMQLDMEDGRTWELGLDFNYTSVFQDGGVVNITHLKQGQQVGVLSSRYHGAMMAKAIEIRPFNVLLAVN